MDQIDKQINDYIESYVKECLENVPSLASLAEWQKEEVAQKIRSYLYKSMVDTLIDKLDEGQLNQIKDLDFASDEFAQKAELFAAQIPGFYLDLEEKLQKEVEQIKQTGQIPQ